MGVGEWARRSGGAVQGSTESAFTMASFWKQYLWLCTGDPVDDKKKAIMYTRHMTKRGVDRLDEHNTMMTPRPPNYFKGKITRVHLMDMHGRCMNPYLRTIGEANGTLVSLGLFRVFCRSALVEWSGTVCGAQHECRLEEVRSSATAVHSSSLDSARKRSFWRVLSMVSMVWCALFPRAYGSHAVVHGRNRYVALGIEWKGWQ